jgi:hypothetical protein
MNLHIHRGTVLVAPAGYRTMAAGERYYFLYHDAKNGRVILVHFELPSCIADFVFLSVADFERAIPTDAESSNTICNHGTPSALPPWLSELEGQCLLNREARRRSKKISYGKRTANRLAHIKPLVERLEEVLSLRNPATAINEHARASEPPQHESRLRTWLLAYVIFGYNEAALLPPLHRSGRWSRGQYGLSAKLGRPSLSAGKGAGFNMTPELGQRCADAFVQEVALSDTWEVAYRKSVKTFGAEAVATGNGRFVYKHPEGLPFPSIHQYRYWVLKILGKAAVQRQLFGEVRVSNRLTAPHGVVTAEVCKLMEKVDEDAYQVKELPRPFLPDIPALPLYVVRLVDRLTCSIPGVGFSLGSERNSAYRMASFCAAVPKSFFCALFGLQISDEQWPMVGISADRIRDRGPGAKSIADDPSLIKEMTPSYRPKSKPGVETANPRNRKIEGAPNFVASSLDAVQLCRKQILKAIKHNHTADMEGRASPELLRDGNLLTPQELWNYFASLGRSCAIMIAISDAVRTFLSRKQFRLTNAGIEVGPFLYNSDELISTGILDAIPRGSNVPAVGYFIDLNPRVIWVDLEGRLFQLEMRQPYRLDEDQMRLTMRDIETLDEVMHVRDSEFKPHRAAAQAHFASQFEEQTGLPYDSEKRVSGRRKKSKGGGAMRGAFDDQPDAEAA